MANRYPDYDRERYSRRWDEENERVGRGGRDRGFVDRAGDEVRSWFGDEEAERRRRIDEREGYTGGSYPRDFGRSREDYTGSRYGEPRRHGPEYGREGTTGGKYGSDYGRTWGATREGWSDYERFGEPRWERERGWGGETGRGSFGTTYGTDDWQGYGGGQATPRGRFSGRGPANYQRSDDRIREDINDRLTDHPDIDPTNVECTVRNGEVTLTGTVDSRHAKRLAEDIAESASGVKDVQNQIRITQETQNQTQSWGGEEKQSMKTKTT